MQEERVLKEPKPSIKPKPTHLFIQKAEKGPVTSQKLPEVSSCISFTCGDGFTNDKESSCKPQVYDDQVSNILTLQQAKPPEDMDAILTLPLSRSVISFDDENFDITSSFDSQTYSSISRTLDKKVFMKCEYLNNENMIGKSQNLDGSESLHNDLVRVCWKSEEFLAADPIASIEGLGFDTDTYNSVENVSLARIEPSPEMFLDNILRKRRSMKNSKSIAKESENLSKGLESDDPGLSFYIPSINDGYSDDGEDEEKHFELNDAEIQSPQNNENPSVTQDMPFYANLHALDEETRKSLSPEDKEQIRRMNLFFGVKKDTKTDLEVEVFNSIISGNSLTTRVHTKAKHQRGRRRLSHLKTNVKESPTSHASGQLLQDLSRVKKWASDKVQTQFHRGKNRSIEDLLSFSGISIADWPSWKQKFIKVMKKHFKRMEEKEAESTVVVATFGVPLEMCPMSSNNRLVPAIVEFCITVIENLGLSSQGIYRIPGNNASVNALLTELNKDPDSITFENERWQDVNVIGSLLKLFFRKLPEPLIKSGIYDDIVHTAKCPHREKKLLKLKLHLLKLPPTNIETLKYLANHLRRVADNLEVNKMDAHNLAIMFGPSLVRPREESTTQMLSDMKYQTDIVENIIKYCDWMFSDWSNMSDVPSDERDQTYDPGSSSNMELLPNAEALLAINLNEVEPESPEELSSRSFFKQGLIRLSNRGKSKRKSSKTEGPSRVIPNSEREVILKKANLDNINRLVYKWKSRNPELARATAPDLRRNFTQRYAAKTLEISAPLRAISPQRSEVSDDQKANENVFSSIKRYPAYSFQNTTIGGSNHRSRATSNQGGTHQLGPKLSEGNEPLSEFGGKVTCHATGALEKISGYRSPATNNFKYKPQHSTESENSDVFSAESWVGRKESFVIRKPGGRGYFASSNAGGINLFSGHSCMSKMPFERKDIIREAENASSVKAGQNYMDRRKELLHPVSNNCGADIPLLRTCHGL